MKLRGRVIVVTGAAGGIGGGIARALAAEGATLILADRDGPGAARLSEALRAGGGVAESVEVDVTDRGQVVGLIDRVVARHGRIDQLWNNAGIVQVGPLLEISAEEWRRVFAVNVDGALFGTQAAVGHMLRQDPDPEFGYRGKIVNTSSGAADVGRPMLAAYGASKAALNHLTKSTAAAFADRGICATILYPGNVYEGMWKNIAPRWAEFEGVPAEEVARRRAEETVRGRFQTPDELGEVARFIALSRGMALSGKIVVAEPTVRPA